MDWNFSEGTSPSNLTQQTVKSTHCRGLWPFCPGKQNDWETRNLPPPKNMLVSYLITCAPHVWNISPTFAIPNLYDTYIIYKHSSPHIGDMYFWIIFLLPLPKLGVTSNGRTPCGAGFFGMLGDGGEASAKRGLRRWGAMGIGGFFGFRKRCVIIIGYSDL